jgi:hypothetical protein
MAVGVNVVTIEPKNYPSLKEKTGCASPAAPHCARSCGNAS